MRAARRTSDLVEAKEDAVPLAYVACPKTLHCDSARASLYLSPSRKNVFYLTGPLSPTPVLLLHNQGCESSRQGAPQPRPLPVRGRLGYQLPILHPMRGVGRLAEATGACKGRDPGWIGCSSGCTSGEEGYFLLEEMKWEIRRKGKRR
jgi:hypothetical protein